MKTIDDWLDEYGLYHKNEINKIIHWICIPLIILSLFGMLSIVKLFNFNILNTTFCVTLCHFFIVFALFFYLRLSYLMSLGMLLFSLLCLIAIYQVELLFQSVYYLFSLHIGIFIFAWILQFIGHEIEGKKPAFVEDLKFLLIGPAWLLGFIYKKVGIKY